MDRRHAIPLAYKGTSRFHTSAVANIAKLARVAAEVPGSRVLNIADPLPPTVAEIAAFIARHLDYSGRIVEVDEQIDPPIIGRTPWSVPRPFVVDCKAALDLGYSPTTTYADAVRSTCDWLVANASDGDWKERFPVLAAYPRNLFDYDAEDVFLMRRNPALMPNSN
jgi:nucleoside-diphosphate-sugar epimerase